MKKINLLIAAGLLASASMQAQTIAQVGFESGDQKYTTTSAYTPGGTYGNWVNKQDEDEWDEQYTGEIHSGANAFQMLNAEVEGAENTWMRGFVVGNLQPKENTSYRVSFWVKADMGNKLKSSMFVGHEYCDMPISTKSGQQYYYCTENTSNGIKLDPMSGDWQHVSYLTFFTNKADQDALGESYAGKEDPNGNIPMPAGSPFPNEYGVIINMYSPGEYVLDDIKVEEGVTFNQASFCADVIRLDFGYPTNIADLVAENNGAFTLDPSLVSVIVNGEAAPVAFVEGMSDGFLYIFLDDVYLEEEDDVIVSFPDADNTPIVYNTDRRPSADTESEMHVYGFTNEKAYPAEDFDVLPSAWSPAEFVSATPEDGSFELDPATFKNVAVTYNKALDLSTASATLAWSDNFGDHTEDLSDGMTLSEDGKTINIALSELEDGEYTIILSGVANSYGIDCLDDVELTYSVGEDEDESESEEIFVTDFDNEPNGSIPVGWRTWNPDHGFHLYGFNEDGSRIIYAWGGQPGGGGCKLEGGFSGDFKQAMYWGSRDDTSEPAYADFGAQISDYIQADGSLAEDTPEGIALKLTPRKYQISFLMAAWKNAPKFTFTLEDLKGNVYAKFTDITATPTLCYVNSDNQTVKYNDGKVTGSKKCVTDFTVEEEGYYVLKFVAPQEQWQELCLANVKLITMPSKAAYYKNMLKKAVAEVEPIVEMASGAEYDGDTKTAFMAAYNSAKNDKFNSPSAVEALIAELGELATKMETRVNNIDEFGIGVLEAQLAYDDLEEKYKNTEVAQNAKALLDKYAEVNPSALPDDELADATAKLKSVSAQIGNVASVVNILTYGAGVAAKTAKALGADASAVDELVTDDRDVVNSVNAAATIELYKKIAAGEDLDAYRSSVYDDTAEAIEEVPADNNGEYDENGLPRVIYGIDFSGIIYNPHLYTYITDGNKALVDNDIVGWMCTEYEGGSVHCNNGTAATADKPVEDIMLNAWSGGAEYKFYQTLENVPVGTYAVYLGSRTAKKNNPNPETEEYGVFNAQDDETGIWDKYIFAQVDDEDPIMVPFAVGGAGVHTTVIPNVTVKEGQKLTIGAVEHYVSGKASAHDWDTETGAYVPTDRWNTNTYVDDARLYFVAPLDGYDYAKAAGDMETGIEMVEAAKAAKTNVLYNVAGQRVNASYKGIVIKNGKKYIVK